ncbi:hypothetical protein BDB00DRAFT_823535 [Zychaea mexicana]|uniref:uncharacterized protein n=1 Tax=Zychaea mexicana TaxID=64656 RepID=UPI0022FE8E99|nr:uncharacterized protein BDB00DRAFT_823535 [Zychaea mexicana]KAI9493323.1 hypothetical protein BDB00DRAFT_823535 [Zychaea mexicana]
MVQLYSVQQRMMGSACMLVILVITTFLLMAVPHALAHNHPCRRHGQPCQATDARGSCCDGHVCEYDSSSMMNTCRK